MIATSFLTLYSAGLSPWTYLATGMLGLIFALQLKSPETNSNRIFQGSISYLSLYSIVLVVAVFI
jgi:hypothetical protein